MIIMNFIYIYIFNFIELADLRRKFEEDKKRIAELKFSRRFKPY